MTTNVKIFRSTDPGAAAYTLYGNAPGSTGGAGGWIGVLRACLISGYGGKTASTATVASTVVTFTSTAHGFIPGQCLLLAGATGDSATPINGERYVVAITVDTFTFVAPAHADGATAGTLTAKVAPAGWTEPYSPTTTNITCFKQGAGNGFYFNIDETAVQVSRVAGFESMTSCNVANGTGSFPTAALLAGGLSWNRGSTSNTTAVAWTVIATDRHLYMYVNNTSSSTGIDGMFMGMTDLKVYRTGDVFATLIMGGANTTTTSNNSGHATIAGLASVVTGHFFPRSFTQIGSCVQGAKNTIDALSGANTTLGSVGMAFPMPVDNGLWLSKTRAWEPSYPRGEIPGLWGPLHIKPLVHLDTLVGTGDLAGKTFMVFNGYTAGQLMMEISNTWSI